MCLILITIASAESVVLCSALTFFQPVRHVAAWFGSSVRYGVSGFGPVRFHTNGRYNRIRNFFFVTFDDFNGSLTRQTRATNKDVGRVQLILSHLLCQSSHTGEWTRADNLHLIYPGTFVSNDELVDCSRTFGAKDPKLVADRE